MNDGIMQNKLQETALRESEYWLKESQRISQMGSYVFDIPNNRWTCSSNLDVIFGIDDSYIKTLENWGLLIHSDDRDRMLQYIGSVIAKPQSFFAEYRIIRPSDGQERHIEGHGDLVYDENGKAVKLFGIIRDISEQKLAEKALNESEMQYRSLFKNMSEGFAYCQGIFDGNQMVDFVYLEVNEAFGELTALGQVVGKKITDIIPGIRESHPEMFEIYGRVASGGKPEKFEIYMEFMKVWLSVSVYSPAPGYFCAVFDNITTRKNTEIKLRQLSTAIEQSPASVVITDIQGRIEYVNAKFERVTGYSRDEVIGKNPHILKSGSMSRKVYENLWQTILAGREWRGEFLNRKKNGETYWELASINPIVNDQGMPTHFVAVKEDITEQKNTEALIKKNEERFRLITGTIEEVFWLADATLAGMLYVSPAYEQIWGKPVETLYQHPGSFMEAIHPEDLERVTACFENKKTGLPFEVEYRIIRPDGTMRWINDRGYPVKDESDTVTRYTGIAQDISERKKLEERFLRAQRMDSIGTLAGGIAHDLNNILAPILMGCELLGMDLPGEKKKEMIANMQACAERGSEIVRQVLSFARGSEGRRVMVQPRHLIKDVAQIVRETFPKNIRISTHLDDSLWEVQCDPTQLHQVLLNLCVNARDAMLQTGGELTLKASNADVDAEYFAAQHEVKSGPFVLLEVADTGTGIPPEFLGKIFDPFFTTKEIGKGTGLGLSTVLGIVKSHEGFINVYSEPSRGTRIHVYIPAALDESGDGPALSLVEEAPSGSGETILIVDDELSILTATQHALEAGGYRVLSATDGAEGVAMYVQNSRTIAVVLLDMMMPVMGGQAAIHALQRINPNVKIIASSGLATREQLTGLTGTCHFLSKPFKKGLLLNMIHMLLKE